MKKIQVYFLFNSIFFPAKFKSLYKNLNSRLRFYNFLKNIEDFVDSLQNKMRKYKPRMTLLIGLREKQFVQTCCPLPEPYLTSCECSLTLCCTFKSLTTLPQVTYLKSEKQKREKHVSSYSERTSYKRPEYKLLKHLEILKLTVFVSKRTLRY